jgi:prepilin-type N-terminal cleavage/methylation domain-containing protein
MKNRLGTRGFSLIEMTVVIGMLSGISAVLYSAFAAQAATRARETGNVIAQNDVRGAVERMVREIQSAGFDPCGTAGAGFLALEDGVIRFSTDTNRDCSLELSAGEYRGFELSEGKLRAWLGAAASSTVVTGVESLHFDYLDALGAPTLAPSAVREVRITVGVEASSANPSVKRLTGTAYIRNV